MAKTHLPLSIHFLVPGLPFDGDTLKAKSLGGSESAGYYMGRALAKRGHRVKMFTTAEVEMERDSVQYLPISQWQSYVSAAASDVHVTQRAPEALVNRIATKLNVLWCHDLAHRRNADTMRAAKWQTDKTILLSQFHVEQYKSVVGYEDRELYQSRNGFDFDLQPAIKDLSQRDPNLYVYAARPERGLEHVLKTVFPAILAKNQAAKLAVCTYDNSIAELGPFYAELARLAANLPVVNMGSLTKAKLYELFQRAACYLYPTPGPRGVEFAEISCIAAIEAQACGLPFMHTGVGALSETLPIDDLTLATVDDMADKALALVESPALWKSVQQRQLDHVRSYDWNTIAAEWENMFHEEIARNNSDNTSLGAWFFKRSEIEGASLALEHENNNIANTIKAEIADKYAFAKSHEALAEHYSTMGATIKADLETRKHLFTADYVQNNREPRFQLMLEILRAEKVTSIFDAGCGHGWSSMFFAMNLDIPVLGYDVDPGAISWARDIRDQVEKETGKQPRAEFYNEWRLAEIAAKRGNSPGADCAICSEVLEHVVDPNAFIERVERSVRPGGLILVTVPFGPWEYGGINWGPLGRTHIRELEQADMFEMFGHKQDFKCGAVQSAIHTTLNDPLGFFIVSWRADGQLTRPRDMFRKLRVQRPTESLSVNIIAGPRAELTMRWTLDSVKNIADEIVVGNTGMNEAALQACRDYGCKVIPAPNPLEHGFDAARNAVLNESAGEWVLWIDTDERLCEPEQLRKYLRRNASNGYGLRQVHSAIDDKIEPDTPVRLFRRDSGCRFIGRIHEHPEVDFNKGPGNVCILGGMPAIWHMGYETNQVRAARFMRNRPMVERDRIDYPQRALGIYLDARDHIMLMNEMLARTQGKINDAAQEYARRALQLCKDYDASDIFLAGISTEQFKTDALRVLGQGFDATVVVRLNRDGIGDPGQHPQRFENEESLRAFIDKQIKSKIEKLNGSYW